MAKPFLSNFEIALTPLSPVHIGCGEDYEPTSFVVENGLLYSFASGTVALPEKQRNELRMLVGPAAVEDAGISRIARFFDKYKQTFKPFAQSIVPIDSAPLKQFRNLLEGAKGPDLKTIAQNRIERTSYCIRGGFSMPYLPGSSLKGALHTALFDRIHQAKGTGPIEKKDGGLKLDEILLGGTMNLSPMRLISVSDFMPTSESVITRITMGRRISKKHPLTEPPEQAIPVAFEVVEKAQYQAFKGSLTLRQSHGLPGEPDPQRSYQTVNDICKDLNRFSLAQFRQSAEQKYWTNSPNATAKWFA
ncbi:MAG TPA: hypothetical protein DEO49_07155, partial [Sutterella sp.]|nr:hypothetical protein [Sutterella sp.]